MQKDTFWILSMHDIILNICVNFSANFTMAEFVHLAHFQCQTSDGMHSAVVVIITAAGSLFLAIL